jgi:putative permease
MFGIMDINIKRMRYMMNKNWFEKEKLIRYLLVVSIVAVGIIGFYYLHQLTSGIINNFVSALSAVLIPFVIAFFLSFIVGPLASWMEKKFKINQNLSIVIAIFIGILFIVLVIGIVIIFILSQISSVLNSLLALVDGDSVKALITEITVLIDEYFKTNSFTDVITEITNNGASVERVMNLVGVVLLTFTGIVSGLFRIIAIFVLTPVFMFYLIKEKEYIFLNLAKVAPKKIRHHVIELGKRSDEVIKNYFRGQGIMIGIISTYFAVTLGVLSFFIPDFRIEYAIMFAILMGLMNIIPYIGAWIGLSVPIIYMLTMYLEAGSSESIYIYGIIAILVIHLVEQGLEISIIQPNVLGKQVHIHPLLVLSSLIFFGGIFGFAGVLLAVPLAGTLRAVAIYLNEINPSEEPIEPKRKGKRKKVEPESEIKP